MKHTPTPWRQTNTDQVRGLQEESERRMNHVNRKGS